jgi:hypothetical protein
MDWALVFVIVVTFAGVVLGGWMGEKLEDWWHRR